MANTQLTYSATPNSSFAKKTVTLKVNALNNTKDDIKLSKNDSITITIPSGLVQDLNLQAETPVNSGYFVSKGIDPGEYIVKINPFSSTDFIIKPSVSLEISFVNTAIGSQTGNYIIGAKELISDETNSAEILFTIEVEQQKVIAWLDPKYIGDLETSKLYWQVPSGTSAISIAGYPNQRDVPIKNVTIDGNVDVYLLPGNVDLQRSYQVIAISGASELKSEIQILQKNAPLISLFNATDTNNVPIGSKEIGFNDTIELNWLTDYATVAILTSPLTPNEIVFKRDLQVKVKPGFDIIKTYFGFYDQLPLSAIYYLTVNGMDQPQQERISLKFKPATLVYYKYTSSAKTSTVFKTDPENYFGAVESSPEGVFQLTIYQPGGIVEIHYPDGVVDDKTTLNNEIK